MALNVCSPVTSRGSENVRLSLGAEVTVVNHVFVIVRPQESVEAHHLKVVRDSWGIISLWTRDPQTICVLLMTGLCDLSPDLTLNACVILHLLKLQKQTMILYTFQPCCRFERH